MKPNTLSYIMPTYGDRGIEFKEGKGSYLTSIDNKKYLDFGAGIAVNSLGHCHPVLVDKLKKQASKLWHTSNLYYNSEQEEYAKILCQNTFAEKVFFTNSGAEAIEAGIKVIRSFHSHNKNTHKKNQRSGGGNRWRRQSRTKIYRYFAWAFGKRVFFDVEKRRISL